MIPRFRTDTTENTLQSVKKSLTERTVASYLKIHLKHKKMGKLRKSVFLCSYAVVLLVTMWPESWAAPQGPVFSPNSPGKSVEPEMALLVQQDDDNNVYFDIYTLRGQENKIMYAKNQVLVVTIQCPDNVQDTLENELWRFITSTLGLTVADLDILLFPSEAGRRVLLKKDKLTRDECRAKIKDVLKPYIPTPGLDGQTEAPILLTPYEQMAVYAQNDTNDKKGPIKYYELTLPKEEKTGKRNEPIPRKKLIEMKPYYSKDPSWMAKILRDLRPNKEVVLRGRLLPGVPVRPMIDDYRGPKTLKITRRILQGVADQSGVPNLKSKIRFEMSHPVPAPMMLDYLTPNKKVVVSRRVVSPLFRNDSVELVEEFEYVEVE